MAAAAPDSDGKPDRSMLQLRDFLKFFATKREVFDTEIAGQFRDVEAARLGDAMYSIDDVRSILEDAKEGVKETALRELEKHANMAGLVLEQVFAASIIGGLELNIDLSRTEDAAALERVGKLKLLDRKALEDTKRMAAAQLDSLNAQHLKLMKRVKELEAAQEARMLEAAKANAEADRLRADHGDLVRRLEAAEAAAEAAAGASAAAPAAAPAAPSAPAPAATASLSAERDSLRERNASLVTELEDLKAELAACQAAGRGSDADGGAEDTEASPASGAAAPRITKQFQRMREMLKAKTQQVKTLRTRLSKYEPDDVKVVDEADETPLVPKLG
ncbi:hypothetical protein FNF31_03809 [Cafeteria roenbergensis]|uniref:Leucine zipper transcription factor-like protein 1 n=1 Tax=Cafeteria roenbergensis TaxID=33653 RepID=A0A5A8D824_CAFRO|nr:hypothetical protein FNF31_03809 [Cafeteria roenbergensis]KAA0169277.1 hypothetical protein FNF28_02231 [Cafeteria roenbergensis]